MDRRLSAGNRDRGGTSQCFFAFRDELRFARFVALGQAGLVGSLHAILPFILQRAMIVCASEDYSR